MTSLNTGVVPLGICHVLCLTKQANTHPFSFLSHFVRSHLALFQLMKQNRSFWNTGINSSVTVYLG